MCGADFGFANNGFAANYGYAAYAGDYGYAGDIAYAGDFGCANNYGYADFGAANYGYAAAAAAPVFADFSYAAVAAPAFDDCAYANNSYGYGFDSFNNGFAGQINYANDWGYAAAAPAYSYANACW